MIDCSTDVQLETVIIFVLHALWVHCCIVETVIAQRKFFFIGNGCALPSFFHDHSSLTEKRAVFSTSEYDMVHLDH